MVSTTAITFSILFLKKERFMFCLGFRSRNVGGHPSAPRALAFFRAPCSVSFGSMFVLQTPFESWCVFICVPVCYVAPFMGRKSEGKKRLGKVCRMTELQYLLFGSRFCFSENLEVWRKHVVSLAKYRSMEKTLHVVQICLVPRPFGCLHVLDGRGG